MKIGKKISAFFAALVLAITGYLSKPAPSPNPTPTPVPTVSATATPVTTSVPTPEITPSPVVQITPTPRSVGCDFEVKECVDNPGGENPYRDVIDEITTAAPRGGTTEKDWVDYMVANLLSRGFCVRSGAPGSRDEVWIKRKDGVTFHYDIVRGDEGNKQPWNHLASRCVVK